MMGTAGASYVRDAGMVVRAAAVRRSPQAFASALLALAVVLALLFSPVLSAAGTAYAAGEGEKSKELLEKAAGAYTEKSGAEGLLEASEKVREGQTNRDTFGYVLKRLLQTGYLNETPSGVAAGNLPEKDVNCNMNDAGRGTLMYHNCDVPNVITEIFQAAVSVIKPSGPVNATTESSRAGFGFGIPSGLPGDGVVPVDPSKRRVKYTALELMGYALKYTSYKGEWDRINVMNSTRFMANYGLVDHMKLGVSAIVNGIASGIQNAAASAISALDSKDFGKAVTGVWEGFTQNGTSASINTILDSSDLNVFNTYGWYRADIGGTLYNARELTQNELYAKVNIGLFESVNGELGTKGQLPQSYLDLKNGPVKPRPNISKCVKDGKEIGTGTPAPGVSENDCLRAGGTWSETGNQRGQTLAEWRTQIARWVAKAKESGIDCTLAEGEGDRANKLANFYACIENQWEDNREAVLKKSGQQVEQGFFEKAFSIAGAIIRYAQRDNNWNAPWARFVCTDEEGKDLKRNGQLVPLFTEDGKLNTAGGCTATRKPIQDGFFGNGYTDSQQQPGKDTRSALVDRGSLFAILDFSAMFSWVNDLGLWVMTTATKVANTALDLSFSPVLQKLGLDKFVTGAITAFRDGIFFPLATLVVMAAGVMILVNAGRRRQYSQGIKTAGVLIAVYFLGVLLMFQPKNMIWLVDALPSKVETAIAGTIFGFAKTTGDNLCTASQSAMKVSNGEWVGLRGEKLPYDPAASVREMECNVWRLFSFEPYVAGQWGASYGELFAASTNEEGRLQNANGATVGDAAVKMGGSVTVNNWALYQLDILTSGTSTTEDLYAPTGTVPRDFYRIVDAQAGPDNGAGTDGRFLQAWAGKNMVSRTFATALGTAAAIVGAGTVLVFAVIKIQLSFVTIFMLMAFPFVLLAGLFPGAPMMRFRGYLGTLLGLMFQRVMLTAALAIMMRILIDVSLSAGNYTLTGLLSIATCLVFLRYRKQILKMAGSKGSVVAGGRAMFAGMAEGEAGRMSRFLPAKLRNEAELRQEQAKAAAGAAVGGFMAGGLTGAREAVLGRPARHKGDAPDPGALELAKRRKSAQMRSEGKFDSLSSVQAAAGTARREALANLREQNADLTKELSATLSARRLSEARAAAEKSMAAEEKELGHQLTSEERQERLAAVSVPRIRPDLSDADDRDAVLAIGKLRSKIADERAAQRTLASKGMSGLERRIARDSRRKGADEAAVRRARNAERSIDIINAGKGTDDLQSHGRKLRESKERISGYEGEIKAIEDDMYRRHASRSGSRKDAMVRELHSMREQLSFATRDVTSGEAEELSSEVSSPAEHPEAGK